MVTETFQLQHNGMIGDSEWPDGRATEFIKTWEEIQELYSSFSFTCSESELFVTIDWEPIIKYIKTNDFSYICKDFLQVEIKSEIDKSYARNHLANYLDLIMSNIFLVANIACPGVLDLYKTNYSVDNCYHRDLSFSSFPFENAWYISHEFNSWPNISCIPLDVVNKWFCSLNIGTRQIADKKIEQTLFSILNFCQEGDKMSPNSIMWLMHALEALYDSPVDSIKRTLRKRIMLVLGEPENETKKISNAIGSLYADRSSYVHGTSNINHPLYNDLFDPSLEKYTDELMKRYGLASAIVVGSLQKWVKEDWKEIKFEESIQCIK